MKIFTEKGIELKCQAAISRSRWFKTKNHWKAVSWEESSSRVGWRRTEFCFILNG
jgi:hypothetical protein